MADYTFAIKYTTIDGSTIVYNGETNSYGHPFSTDLKLTKDYLQKNEELIWVGFKYQGRPNTNLIYNIDKIEQEAFFGCEKLSKIELPNTVKTIHVGSFEKCTNLVEIYIPNSVNYIQSNAFLDCTSLEEITLPETLEILTKKAFLNCTKLKRVYCKATTPPTTNSDSINWLAFENNAEGRKIIVPDESVELYKATKGWSKYANDIVGEKEISKIEYKTTDSNIVEVISDLFGGIIDISSNEYNTSTGVGTIQFLGIVTSIKEDAFADSSNLLSITIPSSVNEIEVSAFSNCDSLESVTIESEDLNISEDSFYGCSNIKEFKGNFTEDGLSLICNGTLIKYAVGSTSLDYNVPDSVTKIGKNSFQDSRLQSVAFNNVNYVSVASFTNSNELKYIYFFTNIEDGIITAESNAFPKNDNLIIYVPIGRFYLYEESPIWNIYNIKENLFAPYNEVRYVLTNGKKCKIEETEKITSISGGRLTIEEITSTDIESVYLPYALEEFANSSFLNFTNLQNIVIPNKITTLPRQCFKGCSSLTNIILNEGLLDIGEQVFLNCVSLKELIIPSSVENIGGGAFNDGTLYNLYCKPSDPPKVPPTNYIKYPIFYNESSANASHFNTNIYVPTESLSKYRNYNDGNNEWYNYQDSIIEIDYNNDNLQPSIGFNIKEDKFKFENSLEYSFEYIKIPEESLKDDNFDFYLDSWGNELPDWVTIENIPSEKKFKITVKDDITEHDRWTPFCIFYKNNSYNSQDGYSGDNTLIGIKREGFIEQYNKNFIDPVIKARTEIINFSNKGGDGEITFDVYGNSSGEINQNNLSFDSSVDWIRGFDLKTLDTSTTNEGVGTVSFIVDENNSDYEDRTGIINLRYTYWPYQKSYEVKIIQSATPTEIVFTHIGSDELNDKSNSLTVPIEVDGYSEGGALSVSFAVNYTTENDLFTLENAGDENTWYRARIVDGNRIAVLVKPNTEVSNRTASITLSLIRDGVTKAQALLLINQKSSFTSLTLLSAEEVNYTYTNNSGIIEYSLFNPIEGTSLVIKSSADWITDLVDSGNSISYNITENTSNTSRTGSIDVSYGNLGFTVTIIQEGYTDTPPTPPPPVIKIQDDYKENYIGEDGEILQIGFTVTDSITNGVITAESSNSWIKITKISESDLYIEIKVENNTGESRTGRVTVYYINSDDNTILSSDNFSVIQEAYTPDEPEEPGEDPELPAPILKLNSSSTINVSYYYHNGTIEYELTNPRDDTSIEVETTVPWIDSFEIYKNSIKFYIHYNYDTESNRKGTITVSYGDLQFEVEVIQKKKSLNTKIYISKYTSNFTYLGGSGYIDYSILDPIDGNNVAVPSSNVGWISINSNSNNKVSFVVSINEHKSVREGTITLTYGNIIESITIIQDYNKNDHNIINYIASSPIHPKEEGFNTNIEVHLYNQNNSGKLIFADNVTKINKEAFINCGSLEEITIPNSVKVIGKRAFVNCNSLRTFKGKFAFDSGRCLKDGDRMIAFAASNTSYSIPDSIKIIYPNTFEGCINLREVTIPESVSSIGDCSFKDCANLETIICLSKTPPNIGTGVFNNDKYVIYVDYSCLEDYKNSEAWYPYKDHIMPFNAEIAENKYSEIRYKTTDGNKLNLYNTNNFGVNIISHSYKKGVGVIKFDGELYKIGDWAFAYCYNLSEIHIPDTTIVIGKNAFLNCTSLFHISIPSSVKALGGKAFAGCFNLLNVELNEGLKVIGKEAFYYCINLYEVILPDSVKAINDFAFSECLSLTNLTIGENTSIIGGESFRGCVNLKRVICKAILPPKINTFWDISWNAFDCTSKDLKIKVPESSYDNYIKAKGWKYYSNIITTRFI